MAYEPGDRATIRSKQFLLVFGIALVIVLIAVAGILFLQRGAHVELKGSILKVRTMGMDDNSSLAVVDFRFANSSDYPFVVRSVDVTATGSDGQNYTSTPVPEVDAKRIFEYYPILGQKYNTSLLTRDKIPGQHSEDRMIVARFEIPVAQLDARKNLKVRIEDVDGPVSELIEK
jgi:ABC-type Na+ efflux pump permease subunit